MMKDRGILLQNKQRPKVEEKLAVGGFYLYRSWQITARDSEGTRGEDT